MPGFVFRAAGGLHEGDDGGPDLLGERGGGTGGGRPQCKGLMLTKVRAEFMRIQRINKKKI